MHGSAGFCSKPIVIESDSDDDKENQVEGNPSDEEEQETEEEERSRQQRLRRELRALGITQTEGMKESIMMKILY
jgi:hypothetical protein